MRRTTRLMFNVMLLANDEKRAKAVQSLLEELKEKGFMEKGEVVYEEEQASEVVEIFDKHLLPKQ